MFYELYKSILKGVFIGVGFYYVMIDNTDPFIILARAFGFLIIYTLFSTINNNQNG